MTNHFRKRLAVCIVIKAGCFKTSGDGKGIIYFPCFGNGAGDLRRQMAMLKDDNTVISLADTGAHCGVLSDASVPTYLLSYLVRDRQRGERLPLERAVQMHTQETANCVGLRDRGTLELGKKADINLIDFDALEMETPRITFDLPAGGRRLYQGAQGYRMTLVNGEVVMADGVATQARPGRLVRGTRKAPQAA